MDTYAPVCNNTTPLKPTIGKNLFRYIFSCIIFNWRYITILKDLFICKITVNILDCPPGFTPYNGDVVGPGLTLFYPADLPKCAADCYKNINCNGFAYSESEYLSCKLVKEKRPTAPKYRDYQFCGITRK